MHSVSRNEIVWNEMENNHRPVAGSLVSANRWLRNTKTYRFPWYLTPVSANHASSNPVQKSTAKRKLVIHVRESFSYI